MEKQTADGPTMESMPDGGSRMAVGVLDLPAGRYCDLVVTGTVTGRGDVQADRVKVVGTLSVEGSLEARALHVVGPCKLARDGCGGDWELVGPLSAQGNLRVERLSLCGRLTVTGEVVSQDLDIELRGPSRVAALRGGRVKVKPRDLLRGFFGRNRGRLEARVVEGEDVHLEGVVAEEVRGRRIRLGPGCVVGRVEYSETLSVDPGAEVREKIRKDSPAHA